LLGASHCHAQTIDDKSSDKSETRVPNPWVWDGVEQPGKGQVNGVAYVTMRSGENKPIVFKKFILLPYNPRTIYEYVASQSTGWITKEEKESRGIRSFAELNAWFLKVSYEKNRVFITSSDGSGAFSFKDIPSGPYILTTYLDAESPTIEGVPVGFSCVTWFRSIDVEDGGKNELILNNDNGCIVPTKREREDKAVDSFFNQLMR